MTWHGALGQTRNCMGWSHWITDCRMGRGHTAHPSHSLFATSFPRELEISSSRIAATPLLTRARGTAEGPFTTSAGTIWGSWVATGVARGTGRSGARPISARRGRTIGTVVANGHRTRRYGVGAGVNYLKRIVRRVSKINK